MNPADSAPLLRIPTRSMGMKLITVGVLALLMTIPALFVYQLVEDRTRRAAEVTKSVGGLMGGPQTFLGPVVAVPYTVFDTEHKTRLDGGLYYIFPVRAETDVAVKTEERHRSLFKVPVYRSNITFKANFEIRDTPPELPQTGQLDWTRAEFITGATDSRGALADATLSGGGKSETMALSGLVNTLLLSAASQPGASLKVFGLRAGPNVKPGAKFEVTANMKFSGAQKLSLLPSGKTSIMTVRGDWPHPGFDGGFLPVSQSVTASGFRASWSIPFIARGVSAEGRSEIIASLAPMAPNVSFVELADPYQSVARSLKYALLFLCLVFSTFFVFETTTGKRVHPAQYFLVGVAQVIFYLLLLSIAERTGFGIAFLIASVCTVGLISLDASWIFASSRQGWRASAVFSLVYSLIYILLTLEDQALLVGSIASFLAIAAVMYFTRSIDWYSQGSSQPNARLTQ